MDGFPAWPTAWHPVWLTLRVAVTA